MTSQLRQRRETSTSATVDRARDAASVEEQHCPPTLLLHRGKLGEERGRERIARLAPQVDDAHRRHRRADTRGQGETLEPRPALRARRRAPVDRDRPLERGTLGGDRTRVVARIRLLLERGVVLFVDDDEPEVANRREDRRARAYDHARLAARDPLALVSTLRLAESGVHDRDPVAEARGEPSYRLRGERDLRYEHDRTPVASEGDSARLEVDLGLAAPGRTVQQQVITPVGERRDDAVDGFPLRIGQRRRLGSPSSTLPRAGGRRSPRRPGA